MGQGGAAPFHTITICDELSPTLLTGPPLIRRRSNVPNPRTLLRSALISGLWQENLRDTDGWRK